MVGLDMLLKRWTVVLTRRNGDFQTTWSTPSGLVRVVGRQSASATLEIPRGRTLVYLYFLHPSPFSLFEGPEWEHINLTNGPWSMTISDGKSDEARGTQLVAAVEGGRSWRRGRLQ